MEYTTDQMEEVCKKLFGEYPEDVTNPIKFAADGLMWLHEIFSSIASEAAKGESGNIRYTRIKRLAEAGEYLALDIGNCTKQHHNSMFRSMVEQGIDCDLLQTAQDALYKKDQETFEREIAIRFEGHLDRKEPRP